MIPRSIAVICPLVLGSLTLPTDSALALSRTPRARAPVTRSASFDLARRIDGNQINMVVTNLGSWAYDMNTGSAGLIFPRGSGKTAVFAAGLWVGAQVGGGTRVTVAEYALEYVPGPMIGGGPASDDAAFHVYKVRRYSGDPQDTAHVDRSPAELAADPQLDSLAHHSWSEYVAGAAPHGAPVRIWRLPDTSTPDPTDSVDVPGPDVRGDLMTWCVYNDANPALHVDNAGSTAPLGIEVQQTTYMFDRPDALGNTEFLSFRIINKGGNTLQNTYISMWSDPDVGGAADDLAGCDRIRNLGYAYNGPGSDLLYGNTAPAVGTVLLRGPRVPNASQPLGLTSFTRYINGTDPASAADSYDYMRGLFPGATPIVDPTTSDITTFMVNGDPLTGKGWIDTNPADRRISVSSGPFTMAPGDTQIVEGALVVSQGPNALQSIAKFDCDVDVIRGAWASGFNTTPVVLVCPEPQSCPEPASFWEDMCAGDPLLTDAQLDAIAACVAQAETTLTAPAGQERTALCATLSPAGSDARHVAKREFAALLANVCAGQLGVKTIAGDSIFLNTGLPISCPSFPWTTIAQLLPRAQLRKGFVGAEYLDHIVTNPTALAPVSWAGGGFGGGAGLMVDFLGSSIDPSMADSIVTVELHFDHTQPQKAYRYLRLERASDGAAPPQGRAYLYGGFRDVPFSVWDVDHGVQLEVGFAERTLTDDNGTILPSLQQPATFDSTWGPDDSPQGGREYLVVYHRPYSGTENPLFTQDGALGALADQLPGLYALWSRRVDASSVIDDGDAFRFDAGQLPSPGLDSLFVALESQPLSDPAVVQSYRDVTQCLQAINAGFGIGTTCNHSTPALISLVSAEADPDRVRLAWQTEAGGAARVERSVPGGAWTPIGVAALREGLLQYEDRSVVAGARYGYRLSIGGAGGAVTGGETWIDVPRAAVLEIRGLTPNPGVGLAISFSLASRSPATLEVLDVAGRRVAARQVGALGPGPHHLALDPAARVPPGVYLIRLTQGGRTLNAKGVLMR